MREAKGEASGTPSPMAQRTSMTDLTARWPATATTSTPRISSASQTWAWETTGSQLLGLGSFPQVSYSYTL